MKLILTRINSVCLVIFLFLLLTIAHFSTGPRSLIDVEFYPAFREAQERGWLCLFSMDRVMISEVSAPYAGWPPLYPFVLGLLGKLGCGYLACLAIVSSISSLLTVLVVGTLLKRWQAWNDFPLVSVFLLFGASLWVSMSTAFAHVMIPLGMSLMALSLGLALNHTRWSWKMLLVSLLCGFLCGLMNWACYFFVPAVAIVWFVGWVAFGRKSSNKVSWKFEWIVLAWLIATTIGLIGAFVTFQFMHNIALQDATALSAPISGASRISVRALPSLSNLAGAGFYTLVRMGICLIPFCLLLSWQWKNRQCSDMNLAVSNPESMVIASAVLSPFLFVACFSGEMAPAAHVFHGRLFIVPAAFLLLVVLRRFSPSRTKRASFVFGCIFLALLSSQAYRCLPPSWIASPSLESQRIGVIAASEDVAMRPDTSSKKLSDFCRTILLQAISWPLTDDRRALSEFLGRSSAWARRHKLFIQENIAKGDVVISHQHVAMLSTYHFDRDVLSLDESQESAKKLEKLADLIGWNRIVVLLPVGYDSKNYGQQKYLLKQEVSCADFSVYRFVEFRK